MSSKATMFCVRLACTACTLAMALAESAALAAVDVQDPGTFVVDHANLLDADTRQKLEKLLKQLELKTTTQIKLLTVPTLEGEDIFPFSQRHADRWKLGQKGKDNGALVVFALKDRRVRIHTYYGLEGTLPDSWIGTLSRQIAQEYFRKGNYSEGLDEMVRSVVQRVADEAGVKLDDAPPPRFMPPRPIEIPAGFFLCAVILLFFLVPFLLTLFRNRHRRRGRKRGSWDWGRVFAPPSGPWGPWSGGSGGGFGSGGFGGGFGGGGGSFGGGGRSGGGGGGASW